VLRETEPCNVNLIPVQMSRSPKLRADAIIHPANASLTHRSPAYCTPWLFLVPPHYPSVACIYTPPMLKSLQFPVNSAFRFSTRECLSTSSITSLILSLSVSSINSFPSPVVDSSVFIPQSCNPLQEIKPHQNHRALPLAIPKRKKLTHETQPPKSSPPRSPSAASSQRSSCSGAHSLVDALGRPGMFSPRGCGMD
jgi:hypothetical protein